jgi:ribose-phosphate pyrophosphokinase
MITLNDQEVEFITFSDGAETCRLPPNRGNDLQTLKVHSENCMIDTMRIALVKNALGDVPVILDIPYLPFGRADRQFEKDMPIPLKVFGDIINNLNFVAVATLDVHSYKAFNYIENLIGLNVPTSLDGFITVAPDKGANKKLDAPIVLDKVRDVTTGRITGMSIIKGQHLIKNNKLVIIDDICDGGRTFIEAAKILRQYNPSKIYLSITHGIFSNGLKDLKSTFDHIIVKNIIGNNKYEC